MVTFSTPVIQFGAFFTYVLPLTLTAYDTAGVVRATVTSTFSSNLTLSGETGSHSGEWLGLSWNEGMASVVITGDPAGGSFTADDVVVIPAPEAPSIGGLLIGLALICLTMKTHLNSTLVLVMKGKDRQGIRFHARRYLHV